LKFKYAVYCYGNTPIMNNTWKMGSMTMTAKKLGAATPGRTPPVQPDYPDEITPQQLEVIRRLADPDGSKAKRRTLLYAPAW
jgi:hypothetical protein